MLSESQVEHVRELLAQALSYREIQKLTGINRGTIGRIARGERPNYERLRRKRAEDESVFDRTEPPIRCPECGKYVYPPCRFCRIRASLARSPLGRVFGNGDLDEPLGLDLRPEHQARYERVRARKLRRIRKGLDEGS